VGVHGLAFDLVCPAATGRLRPSRPPAAALTLPATLSANPVLAYGGPFEPIPVAAKCLYRDELPLPGDAVVPSVGVCH